MSLGSSGLSQSSPAAEGGSGGNATVALPSPIEPPQAFVDHAVPLLGFLTTSYLDLYYNHGVPYPSGVTRLRLSELWNLFYGDWAYNGVFPYGNGLSLSACALSGAELDGFLSDFVTGGLLTNSNAKNLYLYGPDKGSPTGDVGSEADPSTNPALLTLISNGWHGDYKDGDGNQVVF